MPATPVSGSSSNAADAAERPRNRDHRATVQAHKLRMDVASRAISFGELEPVTTRRSSRILFASACIAAVALVVTIGVATVIQML